MMQEQFVKPLFEEKQLKQQFTDYEPEASDWILETGAWDDDGQWIDTEVWDDGE